MEAGDESATGSVNLFNRPELRLGHEDAADPRGVFVLASRARENVTLVAGFRVSTALADTSASPYLPSRTEYGARVSRSRFQRLVRRRLSGRRAEGQWRRGMKAQPAR